MHPKARGDAAPWAHQSGAVAPLGSPQVPAGCPRAGSPVVCRREPQRLHSGTSPTHPCTPPQARCFSLPAASSAGSRAASTRADAAAADGAVGNAPAAHFAGPAHGPATGCGAHLGPGPMLAPEAPPSNPPARQHILAASSCQLGHVSRAGPSLRALRPPQIQSPGAMQPHRTLHPRERGQVQSSPPTEKVAALQAAPVTAAGAPRISPPRSDGRTNLQSPSVRDASALARRLSFSPQRLRRVAAAAAAAHSTGVTALGGPPAETRRLLRPDSPSKACATDKKLRVIRAPTVLSTSSPSRGPTVLGTSQPSRAGSFPHNPSDAPGSSGGDPDLQVDSTTNPVQALQSSSQRPEHQGAPALPMLQDPQAHNNAPRVACSLPAAPPLQAARGAMQHLELQEPAQSSQAHVLRWLQGQAEQGREPERATPRQALHGELPEPNPSCGDAGTWRRPLRGRAAGRQGGSPCAASSEGDPVPRSFSVEGSRSHTVAREGVGTPSVHGVQNSVKHSVELLVLQGEGGVQARQMVPRAQSSESVPSGSPLPVLESRALGSPTLAGHTRGWASPLNRAWPRSSVVRSPGARRGDQRKGDPLFSCALAHSPSGPATSSPDRLDNKASQMEPPSPEAGTGPAISAPRSRPRSPSSTRSPTSSRRAASAASKLPSHPVHQHHLKPILSTAQCYIYSSCSPPGSKPDSKVEVENEGDATVTPLRL